MSDAVRRSRDRAAGVPRAPEGPTGGTGRRRRARRSNRDVRRAVRELTSGGGTGRARPGSAFRERGRSSGPGPSRSPGDVRRTCRSSPRGPSRSEGPSTNSPVRSSPCLPRTSSDRPSPGAILVPASSRGRRRGSVGCNGRARRRSGRHDTFCRPGAAEGVGCGIHSSGTSYVEQKRMVLSPDRHFTPPSRHHRTSPVNVRYALLAVNLSVLRRKFSRVNELSPRSAGSSTEKSTGRGREQDAPRPIERTVEPKNVRVLGNRETSRSVRPGS